MNLFRIWERAPLLRDWVELNLPDPSLIYGSGTGKQERSVQVITALLPLEARVVSTHTSKSVTLPVVGFGVLGKKNFSFIALLRDNFHDLCCQVVSDRKMQIPLSAVYTPKTAEEMEQTRARALDYHMRSSRHRNSTRPEDVQYERSLQTAGDWSWYQNWSHGKVISDDDNYYIINKGFYEGYPEDKGYHSRKYYEGKATKDFSFMANNYEHAAEVFRLALESAANKGK